MEDIGESFKQDIENAGECTGMNRKKDRTRWTLMRGLTGLDR